MRRIEKAVMQFFELSVPAPAKLTWKGIQLIDQFYINGQLPTLAFKGLIEYPVHWNLIRMFLFIGALLHKLLDAAVQDI